MNRGSRAAHAQRDRRPAPFNEAPIHESGKSSRQRIRLADGRAFNEAPIHESGK